MEDKLAQTVSRQVKDVLIDDDSVYIVLNDGSALILQFKESNKIDIHTAMWGQVSNPLH